MDRKQKSYVFGGIFLGLTTLFFIALFATYFINGEASLFPDVINKKPGGKT